MDNVEGWKYGGGGPLYPQARAHYGAPTMHVKEPGEPIKYFTGEDMYRRHEVIEGAAYLYLQDTEANKDVPTDLVDWVRKQVEDSQGV